MEYTPIYEPAIAPEVALDTSADQLLAETVTFRRPRKHVLRCGGYTVDLAANTVEWRGEPLLLSTSETKTLITMLRHAGQILSAQQLGTLLDVAPAKVDNRVHALRSALTELGITAWVPREASGLGYVLWR